MKDSAICSRRPLNLCWVGQLSDVRGFKAGESIASRPEAWGPQRLDYETKRTRKLGFLQNRLPQLGKVYIRQPPEGLQEGVLKPPDPVGIPWARTQPADISF
jgi:hypothetical protein